jgi:hypothetical protein
MLSRTLTPILFALMFVGTFSGSQLLAQTLGASYPPVAYGAGNYGQAGYGSGYVGASPYIPARPQAYAQPTAGYAYAAPVTTYYAPAPNYAYSAGMQYAAAPVNYAAATPIVSNATYYAPVANYPPQTVFPSQSAQPYAAYRPVTAYSPTLPPWRAAPPAYAMNYASPNFYRTNYARTPVTYYRPVMVYDPVTGGANQVLQPATGYEWQARRWQSYRLFPLFNRNTNTTCANCGTCGPYGCNQPTLNTPAPYYVPGTTQPTAVSPYGTQPYAAPGGFFPSTPTTISPPATFAPTTTVPTTTIPSNVPANTIPTLNSGEFNVPTRRDYPPPFDSYSTPYSSNTYSTPTTPIESSVSPTELQRIPLRNEITPVPADERPVLTFPNTTSSFESTNAPVRPQATIRRELNVTPIPDPEYGGAGLKQKTAPALLNSNDRTAKSSNASGVKVVTYDKEIKTIQPTAERKSVQKPAYKVYGDDAWQSSGR